MASLISYTSQLKQCSIDTFRDRFILLANYESAKRGGFGLLAVTFFFACRSVLINSMTGFGKNDANQ
jgi:hypothetical protein